MIVSYSNLLNKIIKNMRTIISIIIIILPFVNNFANIQDTLYVMRNGAVLFKCPVSDIDSMSFENATLIRKSITDKIETDNSYSIFYQGLLSTGLVDSIKADRDKTYNSVVFQQLITATKESNQWFYHELPTLRRFGYTLLMESDFVFNQAGITDIHSLKEYAASVYNQVYPEDAGITDPRNRKNSLNRFIAYHLINKKLKLDMFIDAYDTDHMIKNVDMYEYIETMCPNSLIEIRKIRATNESNIINKVDKTGNAIRIITNSNENDIYNGYCYGIDNVLTFNAEFQEELAGKRLRFDFASFFPELSNNYIRGRGTIKSANNQNPHVIIPHGYLGNIKLSASSSIGYLCAYDKFQSYQGDELFINADPGKPYNFEILTPPIPAGTYEVRFGYLSNGKRGVVQFNFDGMPCGFPLNLNKSTIDIGYQIPGSDSSDPLGFRNDKELRNHGFMKGPASYKVPVPGWTTGINARFSNSIIRRIVGTFTFDKTGNHTFTVNGLVPGEFMLDFIEFVPISFLESEDIY